MALSIIFPGGEYATNLIIANVETLSHNDSNCHSFSSDGHVFGGHGPLAHSGSTTGITKQFPTITTKHKNISLIYHSDKYHAHTSPPGGPKQYFTKCKIAIQIILKY